MVDEDSKYEPDQDEVERAIKLIEGVMRVQGVTKKILDERLGKSPGYFAQVLSGRLELKYRHILAILRGLDLEPRVFFRSLFPEPGEAASGARMLERLFAELQRSGYGSYHLANPAPPPSPAQPSAISPDELDRRIQAAVTAALAERERKADGGIGGMGGLSEIQPPRARMGREQKR
ncbi:MAG TPA: hypothetical protein VFE33_29285 [Thermoanaerobaculia bacterium]|nr:hypothetical protein [Thermoanaerobaculia bacterium]